MKRKKLNGLFAGALLIPMVFSSFGVPAIYPTVAHAQTKVSTNTTNIKYLSDLKEEFAQVGYKQLLLKDKSESGDGLQVRYRGEKIAFEKGIGAHATSTVVYNVSEFSSTHPYFVGYLAVDARNTSGNGVKFSISLSDDKENWKEVYKSDVVKNDAQYVKIPLDGKKYIKLYAHDNNGNGGDHVVYANAGFATEDYDPTANFKAPVKTLENYDAALSKINYTNEADVEKHTADIYQREFVNQAGFYTINKIYEMENGLYKDAIQYLISNSDALYYFINGGPKPFQGNYENTLIAFGKIYNKYKNELDQQDENKFNLRLAISIASVYANPSGVKFWEAPNRSEDPVRRYETYKELSKEGGIMDQAGTLAAESSRNMANAKWSSKQFRDLSVPMMRWVVDSRMNEDEFFWLADYVLDWAKKNPNKNFMDSYMFVHNKQGAREYSHPRYYSPENRDKWNETYKFAGYFKNEFDEEYKYGNTDVVRSWIVWEEGGVCGAYAKTYSNLAEVVGRPSVTCGQPAHAAAVTWQWNPKGGKDGTGQYEWQIQNNAWSWGETSSEYDDYILGWGNQSKGSDRKRPSSYVMLTTDVLENWDNYVKAKKYTLLANSFENSSDKENILRTALKSESRFLDAWYGLLNLRLNNKNLSSADALAFAKEVQQTFTYYPMIMIDFLTDIGAKVTSPTDTAELDFLRLNGLNKAYSLTDKDYDKSRQPWVAHDVARALLEKEDSALSNFSFDGDNAGAIVINDKFDNSEIHVRYSLDGGNTWIETSDHKIQLTPEQLTSITPEKDIQVGLVGVDNIQTIDILSPKTPADSGIYQNDNEDLFIGNVENLEYSLDSGKTWNAYPQDGLNNTLRFTGEQAVSIRYAPHGLYVGSTNNDYHFTASQDTKEHTYLPLQHVTLHKFSSEQNNSTNAAKNLIDGNQNTSWHSRFDTVDTKEFSVKFDEPRCISKLEYVPTQTGGKNGRWKQIEVLGSNDGENWEKLMTSEELADNTEVKTIPVNAEKSWLYIKIQGLHSYSHDGNPDKFFGGSMLNFYENTTK